MINSQYPFRALKFKFDFQYSMGLDNGVDRYLFLRVDAYGMLPDSSLTKEPIRTSYRVFNDMRHLVTVLNSGSFSPEWKEDLTEALVNRSGVQ